MALPIDQVTCDALRALHEAALQDQAARWAIYERHYDALGHALPWDQCEWTTADYALDRECMEWQRAEEIANLIGDALDIAEARCVDRATSYP
jgi:hypothetical protein